MNNSEIAKKIVAIIGTDNISYMTHCATRLRFNLKDDSKVSLSQLDQVEGVLKAQNKNGQLQVIIGAKVTGVFEELQKIVDISDDIVVENKELKKNVLSRVIEAISGCFGPIIPVLIGCGMIKSVTAILTTFNLISSTSETFQIFSLIGDLLFYFFPFFLAVSAAKKFKTNEFLAVALAAALMYPTIMNGAASAAETGISSLSFFGLPILLVNYKSTIIPIILSVWVMSYVYKFVNRLIPDMFKVLFVPMIVLFIMVPFELIVIGPFGSYVGQWIAQAVSWLYSTNGVIGAFLFGTFRPLLIILGMHYAITPINTQLIAEYGYSVISPANLTGNLAQAGAGLAVFFLLKNKVEKGTALTSGLTALFGVTEPVMFGFNLKYKKPMIFAMLGGGIGAAYINFFGGGATAIILPGLLALPTYIADSYIHIIIGISISIAFAFLGTLIFGISQPEDTLMDSQESNLRLAEKNKKISILQPVQGQVVPLCDVPDEVFSTKTLGDGFAIIPTEGKVFAPFDGTISMVFPTKHALGIESDTGVELLIHIGLDTVNLGGKGFETFVSEGDSIEKGQLLVEFDLAEIDKHKLNSIVSIVVTNVEDYSNFSYSNELDKLTLNLG
ncbi:beta-glucoside-specific PTS transporter subunit IIABC [Enterococcus sp. HY326]|uniref:beta-glucoside-specific PTS transporter subunit IIABC n=1 Tax=Enterococcus sp. HY326 TaxID=2971265 RepID=UPI00223F0836|nr:beta-glucoside-specific PTS transporter subunit IIABC [Enterococcus sp. HY326]